MMKEEGKTTTRDELQGIDYISDERLEELGKGYGLDGGGYAFVRPDADSPLRDLGGVVVFDGDWGYFPGVVDGREMLELSVPFIAWRPWSYGTPWPETVPSPWDGEVYRKALTGTLFESDRECPMCEAEGMVLEEEDGKFLECTHCGGTGYVTAEGGDYAVYGLVDASDLEQLAAVGGLV